MGERPWGQAAECLPNVVWGERPEDQVCVAHLWGQDAQPGEEGDHGGKA